MRLGDRQPAAAGARERRVVTVLFVDLVGFTSRAERLDPEDVSRLLTPYYSRVRAELERFGGTVEKFIGDAVMALFGAPTAHEDDPERAVRAAFAVRAAIDELNARDPELDLQVRIGVNTGQALVVLEARASEGEGMAAGDVVNTAARLQQAAPVAGILVGDATYRATADVVEYTPAEPVAAKGKHLPVAVWQAIEPRTERELPPTGFAPLVARDHELTSLRRAVAAAAGKATPQLVTLVGESGIGKSRLVWELLGELERASEPFLWRRGRSLPYGEGPTFWAFAEIVKTQAGILETDGADVAGAKLRETVAAVVADRAPRDWVESHLRPLVGLGGEERVGPTRRGEAFAAWRTFVEGLAADRLAVLVFEDIQWADEGLLDFLEHLGEWATGARLALVCTARPELLERHHGWGGARIPLGRLSADDTQMLLASLLRGAQVPEALGLALRARVAGNPLWAEEYARMLLDRGLLVRDAESLRLELADELPLPDSVQAIVTARLDELPPRCRGVLQDAAVIGKGFWVGALSHVGGLAPAEIERHLRELKRKGFVRPQPGSSVGGETQYGFWHVLVRDVAYNQIPRAGRAERHRLAAEWIASLAPDRSEQLAEMLAHHYTSAIEYARLCRQDTTDLVERGRMALREAGDRALGLSAFAAAARFYAAALELWPDDDLERGQLLFRYGKARFWAEGAGEDTLEEARKRVVAGGDLETASEADVLLSRLCLMKGGRDATYELAERAVRVLAGAPPSRAKANSLANLAGLMMFYDESERAIRCGFEAMRMAEELGHDDIRAHALNSVGVARVTRGDMGGIADLERSVALTEEINSPESVRGYVNLGSALANIGRLRDAFALYERGVRAAERYGDARGIAWFGAERLYERYWQGEWDEALAAADELIAETADGRDHRAQLGRFVRAWIRLARGDHGEALDDAAHCLAAAREGGDAQGLYPALALGARAALVGGFAQEAVALADELLDDWERGGLAPASFWSADLAFMLVSSGRERRLLETARRVTVRTGWLDAAELVARRDFVRAAELYGEIGALPEAALARQHAASALAAAGRRDDAEAELG
ncbi:MAG: AAA family ATPase, partial [Actinomycetota bacterium]|nr:AAA family ATPase [Actinomycetota bacterium]